MGIVVSALAVWGTAAAETRRSEIAPVQLRHVQLRSDSGTALLTLSLSGPVNAHVFRLHQPERIVIDLPHTHAVGSLPGASADGPVTALRSGFTAQHALRLVLELNAPMRLQQQSMRAGDWQLQIALQSSTLVSAPVRRAPQTPTLAVVSAPPSVAVSAVRAAHAPSGAERPIVIAVDAGHGGDDPGASGQSGTHEKDVTLAIARALAARIDREPGMRAVLTRDGDYFVDLVERRRRAQKAHADMFVSIHADAIRDREVSGASVYILSERGASSQAAKILAEEQNAADLKGGIALADRKSDLRPVLLDVSQSESMGESSEAADRILNALDRVGAVRKREVQQAAFVVLKSPDTPLIPSMLIETAYISNPAEERMLRTPAQQQRLADAICGGISGYFHKFPPEGSLFARAHEPGDPVAGPLARDGT
ncbi:MAG TPA: N-acetylmuramoyl-L-alanine amidase [Steroidobacteraceae bacterium]|jgi:N-acetylmuramoyl-L-alanine amidase|nr:N-acetylmuramoyl-L-alanine amidase [Steroidobacteraceae bacterium]